MSIKTGNAKSLTDEMPLPPIKKRGVCPAMKHVHEYYHAILALRKQNNLSCKVP